MADNTCNGTGAKAPVATATMSKRSRKKTCSICRERYYGYGNNPWPVAVAKGRCCNFCNGAVVIPARFAVMRAEEAARIRATMLAELQAVRQEEAADGQ